MKPQPTKIQLAIMHNESVRASRFVSGVRTSPIAMFLGTFFKQPL